MGAFVVPVDIMDRYPVGTIAEMACAQREAPIQKKKKMTFVGDWSTVIFPVAQV